MLHCLCNMPIKAQLRKFYGKVWRTETRPRILARAGNCCERCGKPDRAKVATTTGRGIFGCWMVWALVDDDRTIPGEWHDDRGQWASVETYHTERREFRIIRVVLTIAHLNHVAGDDRDENLAALCQWCHLIHDRDHHKQTRETRKDGARPLLVS